MRIAPPVVTLLLACTLLLTACSSNGTSTAGHAAEPGPVTTASSPATTRTSTPTRRATTPTTAEPTDDAGWGEPSTRPTITRTCKGDLLVSLDDAITAVTGPCETVTVTASGASVSIESAGTVTVSGQGSTVVAKTVRDVTVTGSDDTVSAPLATGRVRDLGTGNVVTGP